MITWIVGKNEDVEIIYSAYKYTQITQPEISINTYLFGETNFKYIYEKKDIKLFEQNHNIFKNNIIIKISSINKNIMDEKQDQIFEIEKMKKKEIFDLFLSINDIILTKNELFFALNLSKLSDFSTIITLKLLQIDLKLWPNFIETEKNSWFQKFKNNTLIPEQILNNNEIIPMLNYSILSNHKKKPICLFLRAFIKSGKQIWTLHKFWENLI